jgi:hypothetical protein
MIKIVVDHCDVLHDDCPFRNYELNEDGKWICGLPCADGDLCCIEKNEECPYLIQNNSL